MAKKKQIELTKTTVRALVVMDIVAKQGQSADEAKAEWWRTFTSHLTDDDGSFRDDFGSDEQSILAWYQDEDGEVDEPTSGGYEGPFVLRTKVRPAVNPIGEGVEWHLMMGDNFARIASNSDDPKVKAERSAEAARYYAIAADLAPLG